jgi:RhoGEF domain
MYHTSRLAQAPSIPEKPAIIIKSHVPRDIAAEIAQKLEQGPPTALLEKRDDTKHFDSRNHLASSPKHSNVHKTLPTLPNAPMNRPSLHSRPEPISTTPINDGGFPKSSQRKTWMVNTMKAATSHGQLSSPGSSSLASSPSLEVPIARSATGNSVSSTTSSSSTGSQVNGTQYKRGRGYSGFGSLFGGGSSTEDHHQSIKNSITIVSKEPMQQRDSISSTGSTRPPSSADFTPYTSQPVSPLLDGRDPAAKRFIKRYNVIKELVETERTYRNDMILLKEVYYDGALSESSPIDKADVKQLFSNLPTIVDFETEFLALLESSCNSDGGAAVDDNESEITLTDASKGDEQSSCIGMAYIAVVRI